MEHSKRYIVMEVSSIKVISFAITYFYLSGTEIELEKIQYLRAFLDCQEQVCSGLGLNGHAERGKNLVCERS